MNKKEFLEKFVALSSASLILTGCIGNQEHVIHPEPNNREVKFKDIISDSKGDQPMTVYGSSPVAPQPNNNGFQPIIQKR